MLKIKEAIVVEGRYDKNTLSQLVDALIIETGGFQVFKNSGQLELLRRLAASQGLIILTDSDGAGFLIRNHLKGAIPPEQVKHAYIPDIQGKERRKRAPGKEGKLGVEGMRPEVLKEALRRAGATFLDEEAVPPRTAITKADLYAAGLSGRPDSARRRAELLRRLNLPEHLSANALPEVLSRLMERDAFFAMAEELSSGQD
jgi:ribonuclease M5